jgi:glycosyltransferase involved in cell wall biosynthesis
MKILYLQPGPGVGGSKISLFQMLKNAPSSQFSHVALTMPPEPEYEQMLSGYVEKFHYLELPTWQKFRRNNLMELVKSPFSDARRLSNLLPAVRKLVSIIKREKIDLIHTNNSICPVGAFSAWLTHKPHIWHIRESIGARGQYPLILGDKISALLFRQLSDAIVCNSKYTAQFFHQFNLPVEVIMNGLDLQSFQGKKQQGDKLSNLIIGSHSVIAMVGDLTTRMKNHTAFIEMAAKINKSKPNCRFVIFGSTSNLDLTLYTRELKENVERLRLGSNLIFAEFASDIPAMMSSIDILVHPASTEGSGRVVMEAMAAGIPVIGVRSGGVQELIQDGVTGFLVAPKDVNALAEKVSFLLENPRAKEKMGERAAIYARMNFSNESMMRSIIGLYNKIYSRYIPRIPETL